MNGATDHPQEFCPELREERQDPQPLWGQAGGTACCDVRTDYKSSRVSIQLWDGPAPFVQSKPLGECPFPPLGQERARQRGHRSLPLRFLGGRGKNGRDLSSACAPPWRGGEDMATLGAAVSCFSPWRPSKDLSFLQGLVLTPDITGQRSRAAAWSDGIPSLS